MDLVEPYIVNDRTSYRNDLPAPYSLYFYAATGGRNQPVSDDLYLKHAYAHAQCHSMHLGKHAVMRAWLCITGLSRSVDGSILLVQVGESGVICSDCERKAQVIIYGTFIGRCEIIMINTSACVSAAR